MFGPGTRRLAVLTVVVLLSLSGVVGIAEAGDFGSEADHDFNCDGVRDLVRAVPGAYVDGIPGAGVITVTYSGTGEVHQITQATPGVPGVPENNDLFGTAYAGYDRDSDGCDELVVSAPYEDLGSLSNAGAVTVIPGSRNGLRPARSVAYTQNSTGFPDVAEAGDWFGWSVAAGRTHQGTPYLLIGSPGENGPGSRDSGAVHYALAGSVVVIHQDSPGVAGTREHYDRFGEKLAVSDRFFAVSSPSEVIRGQQDPDAIADGMVHVFSHTLNSGRPTPLAGIHQDTAGVSGVPEWGDRFGWSVSVTPYRPSPSSAVGALVAVGSTESVGDMPFAGMAHVLHVSPAGEVRQLAAITQDTPGVTGSAESGDQFGYDVLVANLDPGTAVATPGTAVWAIAVPDEKTATGHVGGLHVFRATWRPGDRDTWLEAGRYGLPSDLVGLYRLRASATRLHLSAWAPPCYTLPWQNLYGTASERAVPLDDDCR